jgi:hypothetical protein
MATDIYSMLTGGYDPRDEQMKQQQAFQQRLGQATTPQAFLATVGSNMGNMLGQGVSNALGAPNKQQKIQRILQSVGNISDPLGQAKEAYKLLQQEGLGQEAQKVLQRIQELQKETDALKQTADLANVDFSSAAAVQQAAQAALRSGDRAGGIALLKEAKQLKEAEEKQAKRKTLVESRAAGIVRNNPDMPAEVVPLVAGDDDLFKEWGKTLFEAKKNNYDLSYQTFDGERVMRLVDKETGTLVKEVVLGKAEQTAPRVSVNVDQKGPNKYAEVVGAEVANRDVGIVTLAETAAESMPKIQDTLAVLRKTKNGPITGIGAEILLNFERVKAKLLKDKGSIEKVKNTELLDAFLGSEVFPMITALGIGARGLDTPAEREFLRGVFTGTIAMSNATLIEMTEIRERIAQRAIDKYNKKLSEGYFKNFEKAQDREMNPITFGSFTTSNWEQ